MTRTAPSPAALPARVTSRKRSFRLESSGKTGGTASEMTRKLGPLDSRAVCASATSCLSFSRTRSRTRTSRCSAM